MRQLIFLFRVWRAWRRYPRLRFGQLIGNAGYAAFPNNRVDPTVDLYNVTNAELIQALNSYAGKTRRIPS